MRPTPEDFTTLWNALGDAREVAKVLGISRDAARSKAFRLRKQGYELKALSRGPTKTPSGGPGEQVRRMREAAGMSQTGLAQALGVAQSSISRVEMGRQPVDGIGGLRKVAETTGFVDTQPPNLPNSKNAAAEFVRIWNGFRDTAKVAELLGISQDAARSRALRLRRRGFDVAVLPPRGPMTPAAAGDGAAVRALRQTAGMSQPELAKALGASQSMVSRVEHGTRSVVALGGLDHIVEVTGQAIPKEPMAAGGHMPNRSRVSAEDFTTLWNTLGDAKKVAQMLGLSHDSVRSKASRLRRKGYDLPLLRRGPTKAAEGDGVVVRTMRRKARMSQAELGKALGVSQSSVSRAERGELDVAALGGLERVAEVTRERMPAHGEGS